MFKKIGKAAEPTAEELEFIYSMLEQLSDSEIIDEMQNTPYPLRTTGFIKRRRREFAAAKKILEKNVKIDDPVVNEARRQHVVRVIETAKTLVGKELLDTYDRDNFDSPNETEAISEALDNRLEYFDGIPELLDAFLRHFTYEEKANGQLYGDMIVQDPLKAIEICRLLILRGTLLGECSICKIWH